MAATAGSRTIDWLRTGSQPLQRAVIKDFCTHRVLTQGAIGLLRKQGLHRVADLVEPHADALHRGSAWADSGWRCAHHYFDPHRGRGLRGWSSALEVCRSSFADACACYRQGSHDQAFFRLGEAVHLLQDVCVPHHARNTAFHGHQRFEAWAERHVHAYPATTVLHVADREVGGWIEHNARVAYECYPLVEGHSLEGYAAAGALLLPLAQSSTAGFLAMFARLVQAEPLPAPAGLQGLPAARKTG
ncbi:MAG: zinc dependent phospholipase C family protein [Syntrophomonadaceae bacterium]|jgi:phospholipase C|nr:zinc dependent phospholipase C family protein [Syntrophomonadaceae bacterium]MDH7498249.1 zinc dependent phospholipase C family protein [Syntrophomonadaceae bacterium]